MNDAFVVSYDPFAMESRVYIMKDGYKEQISVCSEVNELADNLVSLSYKNNIYSIQVHAPFAVICEIKRQVNEKEKSMYSKNKINVEGI